MALTVLILDGDKHVPHGFIDNYDLRYLSVYSALKHFKCCCFVSLWHHVTEINHHHTEGFLKLLVISVTTGHIICARNKDGNNQ